MSPDIPTSLNQLVGYIMLKRPEYQLFKDNPRTYLPNDLDATQIAAVLECAIASTNLADFSECLETKLGSKPPPPQP